MSPFWIKWGGSALWGALVYWLFAAALPRRPVQKVAMLAAVFAAVVETVKLVHTPALDAFRPTLSGKLLLGQHFLYRDIAVYWLAIVLSATVDWCPKVARSDSITTGAG